MKKIVPIFFFVIVGFILGFGVGYNYVKPERKITEEKPIKIGVLGDLSGDYASFLRGAHRGVEIAVDDFQKITDRKIEFILEDQKSCETTETVSIMNKFVSVDKVDVVIGGTCSSTTLVAAPIAENAKTIMISPSSSAPSISSAGDYIFRTYISDVLRAKAIGQKAYELGKRRMAILTDISNDAGIELSENSANEFESLGGSLVAKEEFIQNTNDFRTQLTKIKSANPDSLSIITIGGKQIGLVAKQAREMGINVQIFVPVESAEDPEVLEIGGEAVNGLIYVIPGKAPNTSELDKFFTKYKARYNDEPPTSYLLEAYDATMLALKAVLESDGTKENIKDKLHEVSRSYQGLSGNVLFDSNGDVEKPVLFKQIQDGNFIELR